MARHTAVNRAGKPNCRFDPCPQSFMLKCEKCQTEHDGSFASGRFCSKKCAKSFSSFARRAEINLRVSETLKRVKPRKYITLTCQTCKCEFTVRKLLARTHCSKKCVYSDPKRSEQLSLGAINALKRGRSSGRGTKTQYLFENRKIRCDSLIELTCLNWFVANYAIKQILRGDDHVITYTDFLGKTRRFIPDFYLESEQHKFIVECKSVVMSTSLSDTWHSYKKISDLKRKCLQEYCLQNGFIMMWFTQETDILFYRRVCAEYRNSFCTT